MTYTDKAIEYRNAVLAKDISVCKWVRLACERDERDREKAETAEYPYTYLPKKAEDACRFMENFKHVKGKWAHSGETMKLEPWQCFLVCSIFGWVAKDTGFRRFRRAMLMVPRKNGKSMLAALIGLHMLANDGEAGAEVYSGATTEKQAWEVFKPARLMAITEPDFTEAFNVTVMKASLSLPDGSTFQPIIGKPGDGSSPSCAIIDEYHEHDTDQMFDTMETGMGARDEAQMLIITTAGDNLGGPCYLLQKELERILDGTSENEQFWGLIYTIDKGDDPFSEAALVKANPNYGVSVGIDFLAAKQQEAIRIARKQGIFQTKHLNVWIGARDAFFNVRRWQELAAKDWTIEKYVGTPCYLGLDLASKIDIAALYIVFCLDGGRYALTGRFYIPEARIEGEEQQQYAGWAKEGHLIVTGEEATDFREIQQDILELHSKFGFREIAYDPAYATQLSQNLMDEGVTCVEVRPTVMNFSDAMKSADALIRDGKIEHDGNPAMDWMMANVVAKTDNKDNVYPNKERPESKIDGPVALIMAMNRALAGEADFVYETEGLLTL